MLNRLCGALLYAALSAGPADAFTLTSDEGRFTIEMPSKPKLETRRMRNRIGGDTATSFEWYVDQREPEVTWEVSYRDHNPRVVDAKFPSRIFDDVIQEIQRRDDTKLLSHKFIEHHGMRGLEVRYLNTLHRAQLRSRFFVVGARLYLIQYGGRYDTDNEPHVEGYLNSFRVLR